MNRPLTQSDLIFPSQSLSISSTLHSLKRSALSVRNRLDSITADAEFAASVSDAYGLPLVANERCGSWYIAPAKKAEGVYFKSTDGHMNEWAFSLRRLNLQLLDVVASSGGCVIVDSTRRGKSMPDALSKTIPIWCCVLNRALFPHSSERELHTPPQAVSSSEHAQMEKRIEGFVQQFLSICRPKLPELREKISKPLRPIWMTQASTLPEAPPIFPDFHPIVLCTASRRVHGAEASEGGYIQGAADDHEAWSHGLTPTIFWNNKDQLSSTNEQDLPKLIAQLVEQEKRADAQPLLINPTTNLFVSPTTNLDLTPFDVVISCTPSPLPQANPSAAKTQRYLHLNCQIGKLGSRDLRPQLPRLRAFFEKLPSQPGSVLVCCPTGRDLSVGVALAIICLYTDDNGVFSPQATSPKIDKTYIKRRLAWLTTTSPTLNPSRVTLQSVNAFLMPDPSSARTSKLPQVESTPNKPATEQPTMPSDGAPPPSPPPPEIPTTLFAALYNDSSPWTFTRTLTSALPTHPSGTVTGTATFTPYAPPSSSPPHSSSPTALLYAEEGEFITSTNLRFTTRRKYIYRLVQSPSSAPYIAVHFVDEEPGREGGMGGLFVEMGPLEGSSAEMRAGNREQHLCGGDLYTASWRFGEGMTVERGKEGESRWWEVRYDVKGPKKDYCSETRYTVG